MLSRIVTRYGKKISNISVGGTRLFSASFSEHERPVRPEYPSPVRHGFIPEEWFTYFYPKTGVTGPYVFGGTVSTYLLSKEIYVLEHEFYSGLSLAAVLIIMIKKLGPGLAKWLDKEIDALENSWESSRTNQIITYNDLINHEKTEQWRTEAQKMIVDVKKINVSLQLEAAYRARLANVYHEIKRRLDYQVQLQDVERKIAQKQMVQWIVENVKKAITPEQEKMVLSRCISDLQSFKA